MITAIKYFSILYFRKATKCFEKSFSLNESNEEAAGILADLYVQQNLQVSHINIIYIYI